MKKYNKFIAAFFVICLSLIPLLWFYGKRNLIIDGVDTNFPLDPLIWFERRFFVWTNLSNGGSDFSSSTAGVFFHLTQVIPTLLKFNLQSTEAISIIFWFSTITFSSYFLARTLFPKKQIPQIIFVSFYCLNTYLFNVWENVKVSSIALMFGLPWFIAILIKYNQKSIKLKKFILMALIGSILVSGSGINPAYFITLNFGIILYFISQILFIKNKEGLKTIISSSILVFVLLFLVNAFWIVPTFYFLLFSSKNIRNLSDIGFANWVNSLSQNTSLTNVIRIQGAWDWYTFENSTKIPVYLPYVVNFFNKIPFIVFSYLVPLVALVAYLVKRKSENNKYGLLSLFLVIGIFLGVGTHLPTGVFFTFLTTHIPFLSFFRSPWYIFTPYVVIAYSGLIALVFFQIDNKSKNYYLYKILIYTGSFILIVGNLFYTYPLVTGKIFRSSKHDGFYISFPDYVWNTKEFLATQKSFPRIINYPDDSLESFDWGYKGVDSITDLYSNKEFITASSSVGSNSPLGDISRDFYEFVKKGEYKSAIKVLPYLGADTIFYKKDINTLAPSIKENIKNYTQVTDIGRWSFYKSQNQNLEKVFIPNEIYSIKLANLSDFPRVIDIMSSNGIVVSNEDSSVEEIKELNNEIKNNIIDIVSTEKNNTKHDIADNTQEYNFNITKDSNYYIAAENFGLSDIDSLKFQIDTQSLEYKIVDIGRIDTIGPIHVTKGSHTLKIIFPPSENLVPNIDYSKYANFSNFRNSDQRISPTTLIAYNDSQKLKTINLPIINFNPQLNYQLSFDYKYVYGKIPYVEIFQYNQNSPLKAFSVSLPVSSDWDTYKALANLIPANSKIDLYVNILGDTKGDKSKTLFENFSLKKIYDNKIFLVEKNNSIINSQTQTKITKNTPVEYNIKVQNGSKGYIITFLENYSPEWRLQIKNSSVEPIHFTANGYANAWFVPEGLPEEQNLTIYYSPQKYFNIGIAISTTTAIICIGIFFLKK